MRHVVLAAFLGSWLGCSSTGGTETDNPGSTLLGFESSACKTKPLEPGQQALTVASDADGLQCVEWQPTAEGALKLTLLNFPEPCADTYLGRAELGEGGVLDLSVYKDTCLVARCGTCLFDFDFVVDVPLEQPLALRIGVAACAAEPVTFEDELTLPLDSAPSGVVCRPLARGPLEWDARQRDACAARNMPCGTCTDADMTSCSPGLVCYELGESDSRCLEGCDIDEDCSGELTHCRDGVCQAEGAF